MQRIPALPEDPGESTLSLASFGGPEGAVAPMDALVIGASGGLGSSLVEQLSTCPQIARIFAWSRRPGTSAPSRESVSPTRVVEQQVDLRDERAIFAAAREIAEHRGSLRLVFNAAGRLHDSRTSPPLNPERRLSEVSADNLREIFAVNTFAPILVARAVVPLMARSERSVLASLSARVGSISDNRLGGWYSYRASKAALNQLMRTLSVELRRTHPECVSLLLHPGTVATSLSAPFRRSVAEEKLFTPKATARRLLDLVESSSPEDSGGFFAWDGSPIPW
jgi:NAD(P)-dependent dehydrogenase (short-subunit alcohol dehydrogenase family)